LTEVFAISAAFACRLLAALTRLAAACASAACAARRLAVAVLRALRAVVSSSAETEPLADSAS